MKNPLPGPRLFVLWSPAIRRSQENPLSTQSIPLPRLAWFRWKHILFGFIGFMAVYVLRHNEYFLFDSKAEIWSHYQPFKWWLLPHGLAGGCAIILGPMQFSDRLRQRLTKLHRVIGRIYIFGAFVVAPLGTYIQYFEERIGTKRTFTAAAAVDAILLMATTGIAFAFILKGKVQQHRQWMTRSFAVAIVFLEVRVVSGITGWEKLGDSATEAIVWGCLAFSILFADIILQLRELRRTRMALARAQVTAPAES
jgi:uncharacterized membrane protein